jgi:putative peptidoglycan lipid II flippase
LPAGSLSSLNYAFLIMMLPLGTFAMSLAGAAFPTLSARAAQGEVRQVAQTARRTLATILFLMVPCALGLIVVGLPAIQVVLQRRAFTYESSVLTATALAFYAIGLPAHGSIEILARTCYALKDTRTPVAVGVAAMAANIVLAYALVGPMGHSGIALALSLSTIAEAGVLAWLLGRRLPEFLAADLASSVSKTAAASAALTLVSWLCLNAVRAAGLPPIVQLVVAAGAGALVFFAVAAALRSPDLAIVVEQAKRRLGK